MAIDEHVLVVPASLLDKIGPFTGFQPNAERYLSAILDRQNQSFQPRSQCETDPSFKQLIPYVILECTDATELDCFNTLEGPGKVKSVFTPSEVLGSVAISRSTIREAMIGIAPVCAANSRRRSWSTAAATIGSSDLSMTVQPKWVCPSRDCPHHATSFVPCSGSRGRSDR